MKFSTNGMSSVLRDILKRKKEGVYERAEKVRAARMEKLEEVLEYQALSARKQQLDRESDSVKAEIEKLEEAHGLLDSWKMRKELEKALESEFLQARVGIQFAESREEVMNRIEAFQNFEPGQER